MHTYLGIDIGGTKTAGAIVTQTGAVIAYKDTPTPAQDGGPRVLETALALASELDTPSQGTLAAVGIGAGGQIDPGTGRVLSATDLLPGWAGTDIKGAFEARFAIPAHADNDVNALAMGEARFGAAQGAVTVVFLAIGTGLGGALLVDGVLLRGAHGGGGEFGHLLVNFGKAARTDAGGHVGTWEAYVSGPGLVRTYADLAGPKAFPLTGREIAGLAQADLQGIAARAITCTGEYLGYGLASLANILDPDLIVIGGGLMDLGEALLTPARAILSERGLAHVARCPVVQASLGSTASVIGAAALAMP